MVWHKLLSKQRRRAVVACFRMTPLYNIPRWENGQNWHVQNESRKMFENAFFILFCFLDYRHRASNMFLEGYKRNWLHSEGYSFEDRMIDDLSVSVMSHLFHVLSVTCLTLRLPVHPRKQWSKRKETRRRRRKQSQIPSTSLFCISVVQLWQKRG